MIETGGNSIYVAEGGIEAIVEKIREHIYSKELSKVMPQYLYLRSLEDAHSILKICFQKPQAQNLRPRNL